MTKQEQLRAAQTDAVRRQGGSATSSLAILSYTPAEERAIAEKPSFTRYRAALQASNGAFLFAPADDGTLTVGSFGIDSFGRFVALSGGPNFASESGPGFDSESGGTFDQG